MILTIVLLILGFALLIKGADFLVDGAASIAKRYNVSELMIGLSVVAFGTSMPELSVNILASLNQSTDIALGNVIGSNIANILLILGISSMINPLKVEDSTIWKEIPFSLLAVIVLYVVGNDLLLSSSTNNELSRGDGIIFLLFFVLFLYYVFSSAMKGNVLEEEAENVKPLPIYKSILFIIIGLAGLVIGGNLIIDSSVKIAAYFNVSDRIIGLTVVAFGTSLPELVTSIIAALKKKSDIAVGNVVGSNIFNVFLILGISSSIFPIPIQDISKSNIDMIVLIIATFFLFLFMFTGKRKKIDRWEGGLFTLFYIGYFVYLVKDV